MEIYTESLSPRDGAINLFLSNKFITLFSILFITEIILTVFYLKEMIGAEVFFGIQLGILLIFFLIIRKAGKSKKWQRKYLKSIITESEMYWKKKDDLIQKIKMKAIDDEEAIWEQARELETKAEEAQKILWELEK